MNAVLYCRVSSRGQAESGVSLDAQRKRVAQYAAMHGLNVVDTIVDVVSGSTPLAKREGGARLLALLKNGAGHVVGLKLDRLFRNATDALSSVENWDKQGIRLHLVDMGGAAVDTGSAIGRMMLTMLSGFAAFERDLIAQRTKEALAHKKASGKVYSNSVLGFDRDGQNLVENETEAALIARIQTLRTDGLSYQAIADMLNAEGKTGKRGGRFHACTIRTLLKRIEGA